MLLLQMIENRYHKLQFILSKCLLSDRLLLQFFFKPNLSFMYTKRVNIAKHFVHHLMRDEN